MRSWATVCLALCTACTGNVLCHMKLLAVTRGRRKTPNSKAERKGTRDLMTFRKAMPEGMRRVLIAVSCLVLVVWTVTPSLAHVPTVIQTLQEHADMVAAHGHSHGLEEDLIWAMHGHSHDAADHDHSQLVILPARSAQTFEATSTEWQIGNWTDWSSPLFRLERPPRA